MNLPFTKPHKTTLVTAHLFKLKDTSRGFEPDNREELISVPHSVQSGSSLRQFRDNIKRCDPMMPLRLYDPSLTFYELQFSTAQ